MAFESKEMVVLFHGVALNRRYGILLARRIAEAGYQVVNETFPSRHKTIETLSDSILPSVLERHGAEAASNLHFVTHSMGGLVVRRFLGEHRPSNLGRVVMLAPPNHGSAVADRLLRYWLVRKFIGVNLQALGTREGAFCDALPACADFSLGVIAGWRALNPAGRLWLEAPHDGTVSVASTCLQGMEDHIALPYSHLDMLFRRQTAEQVIAFLREGRFTRLSRKKRLGV